MGTRIMVLGGSLAGLVVLVLIIASCVPIAATNKGSVANGKYVFAAAGGCGCHGPNHAGYRAGSRETLPAAAPFGELFLGPFGSVPARNITPDQATGEGGWLDDDVMDAIRNGIDPEGQQLFPIMPYNSFHFMSDEDVRDLVAYLRTLPAVNNPVPSRQLSVPVPPVPSLPHSPATAPKSGVERGQYLVTAVSVCGDCHTPQTPEGAPDTSKMFAGALVPREAGKFEVAPNITPDEATGIGTWTDQQIAALVKTGTRPDGTKVGGLMAFMISGGFDQFTDGDGAAIAAYLKTVPAVSNRVKLP